MAHSKSILIIDDEESIRFTFENFLSDAGYRVSVAKDYGEALERLDAGEYDLIFADIILGGGRTGIDVMREVRGRRIDCPVVIVTGAPNVETAAEAVRLGAFDYIPKPVYQETLLRVTRMALDHKALIDEKEKYRSNLEAIFRSVKDGILTVDRELRILELNAAVQTMCGIGRDAIGMPFPALQLPCLMSCLSAVTETIESRAPVEKQRLECRNGDGPFRVMTLTTAPLLDRHEAFSGAVLVMRDETRLAVLERDLRERRQFHGIIGRNARMQEIYDLIEDLADVQTTVLITGESGTGKELVAEALHYLGARAQKQLVKVNCAALSESLLESELFGHVKGAFTGAVKDKIGRFQRADGGTIFLDEIGDISQRTQLRLLRVLQEMEFERVGDSTPVRVDVRVIAATNRDLVARVRQGEFREDLYYRLKVVDITLPPLRERTDDIPLLVDHFLTAFNRKLNRDISGVSADVEKFFLEYTWPGNIRELEHVIEHASVLCRQQTITLEHLPRALREEAGRSAVAPPRDLSVDEESMIRSALERTDGNKAKAARLLKMDRKTLYRKLERYGIAGADD